MPRSRLHSQDEEAPWVRASTLTDCFLYWLPVTSFPSRHAERAWLHVFMQRLTLSLQKEAGLRCETCLQMSVMSDNLGENFLRETSQIPKVTGMCRVPDQPAANPPTMEEVKKAQNSGEPLNLKSWFGAYILWIHSKDHDRLRSLFAGYGGMVSFFCTPDPKTTPPVFNITPKMRRAMPVFQKQDVDGLIASTFAMRDSWLPRSKELFGQGMDQRTEFAGVPFVLPLLEARHLLNATQEFRESFFDLFPVFVRESETDRGILLTFREPAYEQIFLTILDDLRAEDINYPQADLVVRTA
jgi:hypothetical protein